MYRHFLQKFCRKACTGRYSWCKFPFQEIFGQLAFVFVAEGAVTEIEGKMDYRNNNPYRIVLPVCKIIANTFLNHIAMERRSNRIFSNFFRIFRCCILLHVKRPVSKASARISSKRNVFAPFVFSANIGTCSCRTRFFHSS